VTITWGLDLIGPITEGRALINRMSTHSCAEAFHVGDTIRSALGRALASTGIDSTMQNLSKPTRAQLAE
jgi:hypothetical protein